jgi:hypothetical protein
LGKVLVKKSNNQVLVKKAVRAVYPVSGGGPVMMLGGGGGGGGPRGKTLRERAGGFLGGVVGVAGALTGSHRSLGGMANAMVSGGATGSQLGSALGRKFVGRRGQARADMKEAERAENARLAAAHKEEFGASGFRDKPIADQRRAYLRGVAVREAEDKQRQREADAASTAYARTFGSERGEEDRNYADMMRQFVSGTGMDPARAGEFMTQFGERINVMQEQQAPSQGQDFAVVNPNQGDSVDQRMQEMAQLPTPQKFLPPSKGAEDASAYAEIVDIEDQSTSANDKILQERLASMRPSEQDEEENPPQPSTTVRVRPSGQRSIFDRPE